MVGKILAGRYEVLDRIGQGGMALVYRGRDLALNRSIAIKILRRQWADDETLVERFQLEARAAASLDGPHVVRVFDVGAEEDVHYIVMELVTGQNLKDYLNQTGPLDPWQALKIADQIAEALSEAHTRQIVHRDIKPQNILLTEEGIAKVTDFGIARAADAGTLVNTGSMLGTAQYLSPEQARGKPVGPSTDLYGLGVVLYEMLTGAPPFSGDSAIAVALRHVQEPVPDVRTLRPDIPAPIAAIVAKLLEKDPEDRYGSADAFRRAVKQVMDPEAVESALVAVPPVKKRGSASADAVAKRKPRWPWLVALLALLLLMGGLVYAVGQWLAGPPAVAVPKVVGMPLAQARSSLTAAGFVVGIVGHNNSALIGKGRVLTEVPPGGTVEKPGVQVQLLISAGPTQVLVPSLVGENRQLALADLKILQLVGKTTTVTSAKPAGEVVGQSPKAETSVAQGSTVTMKVSNGKGTNPSGRVPNLSGMSTSTASSALASAGMTLGNVSYTYSTQAANTIIDQGPPPFGQAPSGTTVNVVISQGISPQANGQPRNTSTVSYTVPSSVTAGSVVKIVITDSAGDEQVYYQQVSPSQAVSFPALWYGQSAQMLTYLNGQQQGAAQTLTAQPSSSSPGAGNGTGNATGG